MNINKKNQDNTLGKKVNQDTRISVTIAKLVSSVLYIGHIPFASGTFGSFAVAIFLPFIPQALTGILLVAIPVLFFTGVWSASVCDGCWGLDNRRVVIDEALGMLVSVAFIPLNFLTVTAAFFLFRFFDITKPAPARQAESLPKGWGVMTDDLIAGIYANISLQLILIIVEKI